MLKSLIAAVTALSVAASGYYATEFSRRTEPRYVPQSRQEIEQVPARTGLWPRHLTAVETFMLEDIISDTSLTPDSTVNRVYFQMAQQYLNRTMEYDMAELDTRSIGESFRVNHEKRRGVCIDYASMAAALVSDEGFPPLMCIMAGESGRHAVFIYRSEYGWGALGNTPLPPVYRSVDSLILSLGDFNRYMVVDLDRNYPRKEWMYGNVDMQELQDAGMNIVGER